MPRGGAHFVSQELEEVLNHYDIGQVHQITPLTAGNRRAPKSVIISENGKFLIKRRSKGKDDIYRVAFAHAVQAKLADAGFPVTSPVPTRDENNTILKLDGHIYELFQFVAGVRYNSSLEATIDAGRQLAHFHKILEDFAAEWNPPKGSFHDSSLVRKKLKNITIDDKRKAREMYEIVDCLTSMYNDASVRVNQLGFDDWPLIVIHGDWHPGNMLFADNRINAVLDFDSVRWAPAVTDLSNGMLQFSIVGDRPNPADWPDYLDQAKLVQFLKGYREVAEIEQHQLDSLLDLMVETMIAEAVLPIAATGFFGHLSGLDFLSMIRRKANWIIESRKTLDSAMSG